MKTIKKIILNTLVAGVILFFVLLIFFPCPDFLNKGFCGCSPTMPGPCPDNWDPINECIKGVDEDCPGEVLYNCKENPEDLWRCD